LMNQLTSRLQDTNAKFQQLLFDLVLRICTDHPFHGMYQIYAGANSHANKKDESAQLRQKATGKVSRHFGSSQKSNTIWISIATTNKVYCQLAAEKDEQRYKSGKRVPLKESAAGARLGSMLSKYPIPSPTMQIKLAADLDYSRVPIMVRFDQVMFIASGVSTPKVITAIADNGAKYKQLVCFKR
jgi:ataxia telangiectasia mutated family protein